jgi:hypothetical protein
MGIQELGLDVSTEDCLSAERAFTYSDLHAMLGNEDTVVWLTPNAVVFPECVERLLSVIQREHAFIFCFSADGDGKGIYVAAFSFAALSEIGDVFRRLLLADAREVNELELTKVGLFGGDNFSAPIFAYLAERYQSLRSVKLEGLVLDEDDIRVLGDISRPDLEIDLKRCRIEGVAAEALAEVLCSNQGPTTLADCNVDYSVIANGLHGNSRLKSLSPRWDFEVDNPRQVVALTGALKENKGLVDLNIWQQPSLSDEIWYAVCDALKTHPALRVLKLRSMGQPQRMAPALLRSRIQALVDMVKINMSIHTIYTDSGYIENEIYQESVIPYLETNCFRPRLLAIQKARPIAYRAKVLGQALIATRRHSNSFWMLLSGNAEVAFPPTPMTIAADANLPTPATTTSTANVAAVAASVMSSLTTTTTSSLSAGTAATATGVVIPSTAFPSETFASTPTVAVTTTANVATPSGGQKRKARPCNPTRE